MVVEEERKLDSGVDPGLHAFFLRSIPSQGRTGQDRAAAGGEGPGTDPESAASCLCPSGSKTASWGGCTSGWEDEAGRVAEPSGLPDGLLRGPVPVVSVDTGWR